MKTYEIAHWTASVKVYEIKANSFYEARDKVQMGEGKYLKERDMIVDTDYIEI